MVNLHESRDALSERLLFPKKFSHNVRVPIATVCSLFESASLPLVTCNGCLLCRFAVEGEVVVSGVIILITVYIVTYVHCHDTPGQNIHNPSL